MDEFHSVKKTRSLRAPAAFDRGRFGWTFQSIQASTAMSFSRIIAFRAATERIVVCAGRCKRIRAGRVFPTHTMNFDTLIHKHETRERAYAPYSHFAVGAALRTKGGRVFVGLQCGESFIWTDDLRRKAAVCSAVAAGEREFWAGWRWWRIRAQPVTPCGACRQVLASFSPRSPFAREALEGGSMNPQSDCCRGQRSILGT